MSNLAEYFSKEPLLRGLDCGCFLGLLVLDRVIDRLRTKCDCRVDIPDYFGRIGGQILLYRLLQRLEAHWIAKNCSNVSAARTRRR